MINVGNIVSLKFSLFLRTWLFGGKETRLRWLCLRRCQLDFSKRKKWKPRKKFWPDSESGLCTRTQFRLLSSERSRRWTWRRRSTSSSARWRPDCNPTNPNPLEIIHSNFFIFIFNRRVCWKVLLKSDLTIFEAAFTIFSQTCLNLIKHFKWVLCFGKI